MNLSVKNAGLIRGLIYPVQFDDDPRTGIDRVMQLVVERRAMDAEPAAYLAAVREALASDDALADLIPQEHSEAVIRTYLEAAADAIALKWNLHG